MDRLRSRIEERGLKRKVFCACVLAAALVIPLAGVAQGLAGVDRVSIRVEPVGLDAVAEHMSDEDLELAVYVAMRAALPRLTVDLVDRTPPLIHLHVDSVPVRADGAEIGHAVHVDTSLRRIATVDYAETEDSENDSFEVEVWSESTLFVSSAATIADNIERVIEDHVTLLASAYLGANSP